jgi:tetratricopeptide (TPR) repeat protein
VNIGFAHFKRHRWDDAIAAYDTALSLSPSDAKAFNGRGEARLAKLEYAAAIADFTAAIDRNTKNYLAFSNRCEARAEANIDLAAALDDCDAALRILPIVTATFGQRALVLLRMGKFADAIADYDKGIAGAPYSAAFVFGRGIAKARNGDKAGSDADVATARRMDDTIGATFANFGLSP